MNIRSIVRPLFGRVPGILAFGAVTLALSSGVASAQCQSWLYDHGAGAPGVNSTVTAVTTWDPDGAGPRQPLLVLAANVTVAGNQVISSGSAQPTLLAWDGERFTALGVIGGGNATAMAVYENDLIIAGSFTSIGGNSLNRIARFDGTTWTAVGGAAGADGTINVARMIGSDLVIGGAFTSIGGVTANRIARFDGDTWTAYADGFTGGTSPAVRTLEVHDGSLYAGGTFASSGATSVNGIARWNGAAWENLGTGAGGTSPTVSSLRSYNGLLYVGGAFTSLNAIAINRLATWNGSTFTGVPLTGSDVHRMFIYNGELYINGFFQAVGGTTVQHLARFNGTSWQIVGDALGANGQYTSSGFTEFNGELVFAHTGFGPAPGVPGQGFSLWNGSSWRQAVLGFNGTVTGVTTYQGDLVAVGFFSAGPGVSSPHVVRWNGSSWSGFGSGLTYGDFAPARAAIQWNSNLVVGGQFPGASGVTNTNRLAMWNGSSWQSITPGGVPNNTVFCFAVFNGDLIVGGNFTSINGQAINRLARFNGTTWSAFGSGMNGQVNALSVYNGELYAAGAFTTADGVTVNRIARWTGSTFAPVTGASGTGTTSDISTLAVSQGELIAGGSFLSISGENARYIAGWNGSRWLGFQDFGGLNSSVASVADVNGTLYIGGAFTSADGSTVNRVARWDSANFRWQGLGTGMTGTVNAVTSWNNQAVYAGLIGGIYDGRVAFTMARYGVAAPLSIDQQPADAVSCVNGPATLSVTASGAGGAISYQWQIESPAGSGTWANLTDGLNAGEGVISGATAQTLSISEFTDRDPSTYRVIVTGPCGTLTSFTATRTVCPSDVDCSGSIDFGDFLEFFNCFDAGDACADIDGVEGTDFGDFLAFFNAFDASC